MLVNKGIVTKKILTIFGWINYSRTQLIPADKASLENLLLLTENKSVYPLDSFLGIHNLPFKITAKMMTEIAREAVCATSYERAAEAIQRHYKVDISGDTVRKVTDFVGQIVFEDDTSRAETALLSHKNSIDKRKKSRRADDVLYLEIDGAMVNTRIKTDNSSWVECKIAIGFLSKDIKEWTTKSGDIRRKISDKNLIGYIGNCHIFKNYVLALAERYDYKHRNQIVVISDGAGWIHKIVTELFPDAVHIIDLSHVKEHIGEFANYVFADKDESQKWIEKIYKFLEEGQISDILDELKHYENKKYPPDILNLYTYIDNHKDCMDYKSYREKNYFVGSGAIESANKYAMQNRMKLQGMRWIKSNAQTMLSLKCRLESQNWIEVEQLVKTKCKYLDL